MGRKEDRRLDDIRERVPHGAAGTRSISVSWDDVIYLLSEVDRLRGVLIAVERWAEKRPIDGP